MKTFSKAPVASVLMITYNHAPYIGAAIEGIVRQATNFSFELLIGDDCSTDGTSEIITSYVRRFPQIIRSFRSRINGGAHLNGRRLLSALRGQYVAFCEGDDSWHDRTKLQKQVSFLNTNPTYGMVHSHSWGYYVETGRLVKNALVLPRSLSDANAYSEIITGQRIIWTLTVCVRGDLLARVESECPECTDPNWPMGDTQRWLEYAHRSKVTCIHESLTTRNFLPESASRSRNPRRVLDFYLAGKRLIDHYLEKYPVGRETLLEAKSQIGLQVMKKAFLAGDSSCAECIIEELRSIGAPLTFDVYLLRFGCRSSSHRSLVRPILKFREIQTRAAGRLGRLLSADYRPTAEARLKNQRLN